MQTTGTQRYVEKNKWCLEILGKWNEWLKLMAYSLPVSWVLREMRALHERCPSLWYAHTTTQRAPAGNPPGGWCCSPAPGPLEGAWCTAAGRSQQWHSPEGTWVAKGRGTARNSTSFIYKHLNYLSLPVVPCMQLQLKKWSNFIHKKNS